MLEVSQNINHATGDPVAKDRIRKTLILREKLEFGKQVWNDVYL